MIFENDIDLPIPVFETIADAAKDREKTEDADFSVTELLQPPQLRRLAQSKLAERLELPISRKMWAVLGKSLHELITLGSDEFSELQMHRRIGDYVISGTIDWGELDRYLYKLWDWKMSSVWTYILEPGHLRTDWVAQLNMYRWLFQCPMPAFSPRDQECDGLNVVCHFRDWRRSELKRKPQDYPPKDIMTIPVPIWPLDRTEAFIIERIQLHVADPRPCSDDETWTRGEKFAVMKDGRKTALRVLDSYDDAAKWMADQSYHNDELYIEHRPGVPIRCTEGYCDVAGICPQHKQWMEDHGQDHDSASG